MSITKAICKRIEFFVGYDGSATFASAVNVNRPDGSTADGFAVLSGAKKRVGIDAAGDVKLGDNILVDEAIYLKGSDGTAIFKGDYVSVGPNPGNSADNARRCNGWNRWRCYHWRFSQGGQ